MWAMNRLQYVSGPRLTHLSVFELGKDFRNFECFALGLSEIFDRSFLNTKPSGSYDQYRELFRVVNQFLNWNLPSHYWDHEKLKKAMFTICTIENVKLHYNILVEMYALPQYYLSIHLYIYLYIYAIVLGTVWVPHDLANNIRHSTTTHNYSNQKCCTNCKTSFMLYTAVCICASKESATSHTVSETYREASCLVMGKDIYVCSPDVVDI